MKLYTQQQGSRITGISPNTIQGWARDGLVVPSIKQDVGRGRARMYTTADIIHIAIIGALTEKAFNRNLIRSLCDYLQGVENGVVRKQGYFDLSKFAKNDLVTIELRDDEWGFNQESREMAPRVTRPKLYGHSRTFVGVNVSQIVKELRPRL